MTAVLRTGERWPPASLAYDRGQALPPTPSAFPTAVGLVTAGLWPALPMGAGLPPVDGSVDGSVDGWPLVVGSNFEF